MKVLIHFPRKNDDRFFEGAVLERQIKKACKNNDITLTDKVGRDVDIANFINLNVSSTAAIRLAANLSIPTLLWMLFANSDDDARILETKKDGRIYIPASRLDTINTMDAVIVPSGETKIKLRSLGVKIPIFVIAAAVDVRVLNELKDSKNDLFRRYFRIGSEQKYAMSVMNVRDRKEIEEMNMLASAVPDVNFYVFVSASKTLSDRIRLKTFNKFTAKNLIVTGLIPEDVYRSGLIDASYFIDLGCEKMSVMTIYEPMYAKVPLIISKKAVISDIVDPKRAFLVKDYNGAAFVIRNNLSSEENVANAFEYTKNVNKENFTAAIFNLFQKIYSR